LCIPCYLSQGRRKIQLCLVSSLLPYA
jgi:hypothetical protein